MPFLSVNCLELGPPEGKKQRQESISPDVRCFTQVYHLSPFTRTLKYKTTYSSAKRWECWRSGRLRQSQGSKRSHMPSFSQPFNYKNWDTDKVTNPRSWEPQLGLWRPRQFLPAEPHGCWRFLFAIEQTTVTILSKLPYHKMWTSLS